MDSSMVTSKNKLTCVKKLNSLNFSFPKHFKNMTTETKI